MPSIADGLPPEIAAQIHPDWRENEAGYWAARQQLFDDYRGRWVAFASGIVVASGDSPVAVGHAALEVTRHAFVTCVGHEGHPTRMRRAVHSYDSMYPGEALPVVEAEFRRDSGVTGVTLDPFIIDTGADASVLPWIDCQRLRLSLSDGVPAVMGGINSSTVTTVYFWIWVVLDGQEYKCRAHVDFMGDERILGRDVLNFMDILLRGPCREAIINP